MASLTEFLFPAPAPRRTGAIIQWWERRRLFYNTVVGAAGLVSMGTLTVAAALLNGTLEMVPWQPAVVFGIMANLCYLLGPAAEIAVHVLWGRSVLPVGPALYRIGLTFSVGLALFPTLLAILWAVAAVVLNLWG